MKKPADVERKWVIFDASNIVLGSLATQIATQLIGKHKRDFTPHVDSGDFVVVINAEKVVLTGKKEIQKMYYHHTGYPGGLRSKSAGELRATYPDRMIRLAVRNMLPKNKLRAERMKRLKVYAGAEHPHASQIASA